METWRLQFSVRRTLNTDGLITNFISGSPSRWARYEFYPIGLSTSRQHKQMGSLALAFSIHNKQQKQMG